MSRDSRLYLDDILEAAKAIKSYLEGVSRKSLDSDGRTRDAVIRNLEVIGEAIKQIPSALTERRPEVDWSGFARMKNILLHQYFGVDLDIIWSAVTTELPGLEAAARAIREGMGKNGGSE